MIRLPMTRRDFLVQITAVALISAGSTSLAAPIESKVEKLGTPDYITVDEIRAAKRNGLLQIQTTIYNNDNQARHMRYRFRWIDAQGFDIGTEEAWKPLVVYGKQSQRIQTVAPMPQAVDFSLQIHADENDTNPSYNEQQ